MKITTYFASPLQRTKLRRSGRVGFSPMTFLLDKVRVEDVLKHGVSSLQDNHLFDLREYLKATFSKCQRYYMTDDMKIVYGSDRTEDNTFEHDITDLFLAILELQIRRGKEDPDHFRFLLKQRIVDLPEYKAVQDQLRKMRY